MSLSFGKICLTVIYVKSADTLGEPHREVRWKLIQKSRSFPVDPRYHHVFTLWLLDAFVKIPLGN